MQAGQFHYILCKMMPGYEALAAIMVGSPGKFIFRLQAFRYGKNCLGKVGSVGG
jgi:hypothetical protein